MFSKGKCLVEGDPKKSWSGIYRSFVTVAVVPDSSMKNSLTMPLAEIAVHIVHSGECSGLVATLFGLEVPQKTFVFEFNFSLRWK